MCSAGLAWMATTSTLVSELQLVLPIWVRARGLAIYAITFAGSQAAGALIWGLVANQVGVQLTVLLAAVVLLAGVIAGMVWRVPRPATSIPGRPTSTGSTRGSPSIPSPRPDPSWCRSSSPSSPSGTVSSSDASPLDEPADAGRRSGHRGLPRAPFLVLRHFTSGDCTSARRRSPYSLLSVNFPRLAHRASSRRSTTWIRLRWRSQGPRRGGGVGELVPAICGGWDALSVHLSSGTPTLARNQVSWFMWT
jgi:hypothetical protein